MSSLTKYSDKNKINEVSPPQLPDLLDTSMELSAGLRGLPESGEHPFKSALHFAAQGGYLHCVQILLE